MTGMITCQDIPEICGYLGIPESLLSEYVTKKGTYIGTYNVYGGEGSTEAVRINIPAEGYGRVSLHGSYFDSNPEHSVYDFKTFMYGRKGNCKRLDISLKDSAGYLDFEEYVRMSSLEDYQKYCAGTSVVCRKKKKGELPDSNNRGGIPDVHANHTLIHYGDANSNSYAKFYICNDGKCKFEVTLMKNEQTKAVLNAYHHRDMSIFNALARQALVKVIDFVTPASKVAKRKVQIESYRKFLGSTVQPIKWSAYTDAKEKLTLAAQMNRTSSRLVSMLLNCIPKFNVSEQDTERIVDDIKALLTPPSDFDFTNDVVL
jgi:hypothetical protein